MATRDRVEARDALALRGAITLEPLRRVATGLGRRAIAITFVVHVEFGIAREWVMLVGHRRVDRSHQDYPLPRMRREQDQAVGRRHLEAVEVGRSAAWRRGNAVALGRARLRVVVSEERAAARVPQHHDPLETLLLAQKAYRCRE